MTFRGMQQDSPIDVNLCYAFVIDEMLIVPQYVVDWLMAPLPVVN